jgi:hypothetical protein
MSTTPENNSEQLEVIPTTKLWKKSFAKDYKDAKKAINALSVICKKHGHHFTRDIGLVLIRKHNLNAALLTMVKIAPHTKKDEDND